VPKGVRVQVPHSPQEKQKGNGLSATHSLLLSCLKAGHGRESLVAIANKLKASSSLPECYTVMGENYMEQSIKPSNLDTQFPPKTEWSTHDKIIDRMEGQIEAFNEKLSIIAVLIIMAVIIGFVLVYTR